MNFVHRVRRVSAVLAASAFVAFASQSYAQEIAESHLKAARAAIDAVNATDAYDNILPAAAQQLKQQLIQQNPDLTDLIISTVDEKTIALAGRRADLEREAAIAYAKVFSEADLNAIAAFYNSESRQEAPGQRADRRPRSREGRRNLAARHFPRSGDRGRQAHRAGGQGSGCG